MQLMKPVLFSFYGVNFQALTIFVFFGFCVFAYLLWKNLRTHIRPFTAFDIVLTSLVISPLVGRVIYVLDNWAVYVNNGWNILPVRDTLEGVAFFDTMPWRIFALWDGGIYYYFTSLGIILSVLIIVRFSRNSKKISVILVNTWKSLIPALIIINFGYLLDGTYKGLKSNLPFSITYVGEEHQRFAIQLVEIVILLLIWLLYLDYKEQKRFLDKRLLRFYFPLLWLFSEFCVWFFVEEANRDLLYFDLSQLVWIIGILIFLASFGFNIDIAKRKKTSNAPIRRGLERGDTDYSVSFARYRKNIPTKLTAKERIQQTKNRIRRGVK